jgi:hypothetical protein
LDKSVSLVCEYLKDIISSVGTASELLEKIKSLNEEQIIPNVLSKRLFQNADKF